MRLFISVNFSPGDPSPPSPGRATGSAASPEDAGASRRTRTCTSRSPSSARVPPARAEDAAAAMRAAAGAPFELVFDRAGRFPPGRGRHLVGRRAGQIPRSAPSNAASRASSPRAASSLSGGRFAPHVTLARRVKNLPEAPGALPGARLGERRGHSAHAQRARRRRAEVHPSSPARPRVGGFLAFRERFAAAWLDFSLSRPRRMWTKEVSHGKENYRRLHRRAAPRLMA